MAMSKLFLKIFSIVGILFATNVIYAQETIKIGAPLALTGGLADEGKKQQIAYDMWLKKVNAAGGIQVGNKKMKVELITYDYQTDEKRAPNGLEGTSAHFGQRAHAQPQ